MSKDSVRKIGIIILLLFQISMIASVTISAMTLDGKVDESDWSYWFTDDDNPEFSTYTYENESNVYLGIITESMIPESAQLEFAFMGAEDDWAILISDSSGIFYKRSKMDPGLGKDHWRGAQLGLPEGVQVVRGYTASNYSYEISISKELLGVHSVDYPDRFKLWIMYTVDGKGDWIWTILDLKGEANFYPASRGDWWFSYDPSDDPEIPIPNDQSNSTEIYTEEEIPDLHLPEFPLGTLMPLIMMLLIVYLKVKTPPKV